MGRSISLHRVPSRPDNCNLLWRRILRSGSKLLKGCPLSGYILPGTQVYGPRLGGKIPSDFEQIELDSLMWTKDNTSVKNS